MESYQALPTSIPGHLRHRTIPTSAPSLCPALPGLTIVPSHCWGCPHLGLMWAELDMYNILCLWGPLPPVLQYYTHLESGFQAVRVFGLEMEKEFVQCTMYPCRYYPTTVCTCAVGSMNLRTCSVLYWYCGTVRSLFLVCHTTALLEHPYKPHWF